MLERERRLARWLTALEESGARAAELDELADHWSCAYDEFVDAGCSPARAAREAGDRLGTPEQLVPEFRKHPPTMSFLQRLLGVAFALSAMALVFGAGGQLIALVQGAVLLLVGGTVLGGLWASCGPRRVIAALRAATSADELLRSHPSELRAHRAVLERGYRLSWSAGLLCTMLGAIQMLTHLADPAQIGPGLGTALLGLLYGVLLAELLFGSMRHTLELALAGVRD